jgi:hypothetical protein
MNSVEFINFNKKFHRVKNIYVDYSLFKMPGYSLMAEIIDFKESAMLLCPIELKKDHHQYYWWWSIG